VSLGQALTPAQTVELTFTFERAGDVTMQVPVAAPSQNVPQTSAFNFEKGGNEGDEPGNEVSGGLPTQRDNGDGEG
jgi:copper(I)-binding protein